MALPMLKVNSARTLSYATIEKKILNSSTAVFHLTDDCSSYFNAVTTTVQSIAINTRTQGSLCMDKSLEIFIKCAVLIVKCLSVQTNLLVPYVFPP